MIGMTSVLGKGGVRMNREEILEKSRDNFHGSDPYEVETYDMFHDFSMTALIFLLLIFSVIDLLSPEPVNWSNNAIIFCITACGFTAKAIREHQLWKWLLSGALWVAALCFAVLYVWQSFS